MSHWYNSQKRNYDKHQILHKNQTNKDKNRAGSKNLVLPYNHTIDACRKAKKIQICWNSINKRKKCEIIGMNIRWTKLLYIFLFLSFFHFYFHYLFLLITRVSIHFFYFSYSGIWLLLMFGMCSFIRSCSFGFFFNFFLLCFGLKRWFSITVCSNQSFELFIFFHLVDVVIVCIVPNSKNLKKNPWICNLITVVLKAYFNTHNKVIVFFFFFAFCLFMFSVLLNKHFHCWKL